MTSKQNSLYWIEWTLAKRKGQLTECDRHTIHLEALGEDKSHKDFENEDLDKVLAAFRAISRPASLNAQIRQLEQPHTRLLKRINDQLKCLALFLDGEPSPTWGTRTRAWLQTLLRDRFHVEHITDLTDPSHLTQLRNTLAARLSKFRRQPLAFSLQPSAFPDRLQPSAFSSEHDMCRAAGVPCFRKHCAQCRNTGCNVTNGSNVTFAPSAQDKPSAIEEYCVDFEHAEENPF